MPGPDPSPSDGPTPLSWVPKLGIWSWSFVGFVVAMIIVVTALGAVSEIVLPMTFAAVLAIVFRPLVGTLVRHRLKPTLAAGLVVLGLLALMAVVVVATVRGVAEQTDEIGASVDAALEEAAGQTGGLGIDKAALDQARAATEEAEPTVTGGVLTQLVEGFNKLVGLASGLILGALIMFYLLKDGTRLRLLSQVYQLTAFDLTKHGEGQLALLAADRGMLAAQQAADPLAAAGCARVLAAALLSAGQDRKAKELCINLAIPLQGQLGVASPTHLSVYGSLLLKASIASSRLGERIGTQELLAEAERAAQRLGRDANCMWTAFGPTNVRVHRVATSVELGDGGTAVEHAKHIRPTRLPSLERRAQCLVDMARGYGQWGRTSEAAKALLAAERMAPEEVRVQPKVRSLVLDLLHQRRRRDPELRRLAHRVGALT